MQYTMDTQDKSSGLPKRPCPVLTKDNSEQWFRRMEIFLRGEDLFHTISTTNQTPITPKTQYKTIWWISLCLGEDDEELVSEMETAKAVWDELKRKYADNKATGRKLLKQYFSFQMTGEMNIDAAWTHLLALGRRIKAAQPKFAAALEPEARIQVLLSGLPDQWSSIRDAIDGQPNLSPDSILSILQEKEVDMPQPQPAATAAAFAAQAASSRGSSSQRGRKHDKFKSDLRCNLCSQRGHSINYCLYLEVAQGVVAVVSASKLVSDTKALALIAQDQDGDWEEDVD